MNPERIKELRDRHDQDDWSDDNCEHLAHSIPECLDEIERLRTALALAMETLDQHGEHLGVCITATQMFGKTCTCGLDEALAQLKALEQERGE